MMGNLVVHLHRVGHGHRPEIYECPLGPVELGMYHICPSHVCDGLNGSFGHTILVMGTNSTERQFLAQPRTVLPKFFRRKYTIVGVVFLDLNPSLCCRLLHSHFPTNGIASRRRAEVAFEHARARVVNIDSTTRVTVTRGAMA
jgi:hypothetical protein